MIQYQTMEGNCVNSCETHTSRFLLHLALLKWVCVWDYIHYFITHMHALSFSQDYDHTYHNTYVVCVNFYT